MYIVSNSVLNEGPVPDITGRYSVIDYIYDGIHIDEYVVASSSSTNTQDSTPSKAMSQA